MKEHTIKRKARDIEREIRNSEPLSKERKELENELHEMKMMRGKNRTKYKRMSLNRLKDEGYGVGDVESYNAHAKRSKDLFGIIDLIAIHPDGNGVLFVQVTSKSNLAAHQKKMLANAVVHVLLKAKNKVELHGWTKVSKRYDVEIRELKLKKPTKKKK